MHVAHTHRVFASALKLASLGIAAATAVAMVACSSPGADTSTTADSAAVAPAMAAMTSDGLLQHIKNLSDDSLEGRGPGTAGETKAITYLSNQFKALGLAPGNPDGTWLQNVALVGFTSKMDASFNVGGKAISLAFPGDFVGVSRHDAPTVDVNNSDIVFVGYGVVAPEYGWDDYKGVDVKGKTIVMLINDPAVPDPTDSTKLDANVFKGSAMTYYGRWTYKYEIASEKGAAAAIIVHETGPAGYPYEVVSGSFGREQFDIVGSNSNRVQVESWITSEKAEALFKAAGKDLAALKVAARKKDFTPVTLGATATIHVKNSVRHVDSHNVIAKLEGRDPAKKNEYVVYSSHWDHIGRDTTAKGDQIFNGAIDNASGTSMLLEIAKAYTKLEKRPARSVIFLAVTAEEKGLLGAKYYAEHPLYPLDKTLANLNMDGVNQWGRTKDLTVIGRGNSTLDDVLQDVLTQRGRTISPDPEPGKGFFYRSDHFEFAKQGVPALYTDSGIEYIGKPPEYSKEKREQFTANDYHKPSDEVKPDWDLSGAIEDGQVFFQVGWRVANGTTWPEWKAGTEFKAKRDSMLSAKH